MRIVYIDIDSLRHDHLGCYGYHRRTSPNIDSLARQGTRFDRMYVSDAPCLPSRTALFSGCFGTRTGVITHGGACSVPHRQLLDPTNPVGLPATNWMGCLQKLGYRTVTISPFTGRHACGHWMINFKEIHDTGRKGRELADDVTAPVEAWLKQNARSDNWFLHVNYWDPHRPFRTPMSYGNPFKDDPLPKWLTEEVRLQHWQRPGPNSAREIMGFSAPDKVVDNLCGECPRQPGKADSMDAIRQMFDGYDVGIRYTDDHVGRLLNCLADQGVLDDTAIIISADHGENLGELNCYCDHGTADEWTTHVPMIVRWPGVTKAGSVDNALRYQFDFAATVLELLGGKVPENWDGRSFVDALRAGRSIAGRDALIMGQALWTCQRGVRFGDSIFVHTYHDGYHGFPQDLLFDVAADPHEQHNLALEQPGTVRRAQDILNAWRSQVLTNGQDDPMDVVLREGGPVLVRGRLPKYLERLRATGRNEWAERFDRPDVSMD